MMYLWQPDMIRFMQDASEYGSYHQALADLLRPWLTARSHICDVGCGLGHLSLALAPYVAHVTAIDLHEAALRVLDETCRARQIKNIRICPGDIAAHVPDTPYDGMVFCFFHGIREILSLSKQQCRGSVFVIQRNYRYHRFSAGSHPSEEGSYPHSLTVLTQLGIPFSHGTAAIEFGQPFRSRSDARLFFELYRREGDTRPITDAFLDAQLVSTGRADFSYYLPHRRNIGWLKWDIRDVPSQINFDCSL